MDYPKKEDIDAVRIPHKKTLQVGKYLEIKFWLNSWLKEKRQDDRNRNSCPMRAKENEAGGVGGKKERKL